MAEMNAPGFEVLKLSYRAGEWVSGRWFTDADIEENDWNNQAIVFNSEASERIKEASKEKHRARTGGATVRTSPQFGPGPFPVRVEACSPPS